MANAGGAWDNAKKLVEVDLREKGTALHAATVVGDTVGDPFKDTTSVSLNPIIKFSTLFGLLAVEIAVGIRGAAEAGRGTDYTVYVGLVMLAIALVFVWRSFYALRIPGRPDGIVRGRPPVGLTTIGGGRRSSVGLLAAAGLVGGERGRRRGVRFGAVGEQPHFWRRLAGGGPAVEAAVGQAGQAQE